MKHTASIFFATVFALSGLAFLAEAAPRTGDMSNPSSEISGIWYTEDRDGGVELYPCGKEICGRFYWLGADNNKPEASRDSKNPDPELRQRTLCKAQFMGGFTPDGKGHFKDGWIYSPRHGATFSAEMTLVDHDTLDLHGYVFIPAL